mmetsp:Transcript_22564/g.36878  ORF Transcript_22564/g.36878 Transcript_22564/m.36878 type:complete len:349 (+) Transcript_22564:168-1214(+)
MRPKRVLVDLDVVAVSLLHGLGKLGPNDAVLLGDGTEALSHAALHTLQATHVDVGLVILHQLPKLFSIFRHLGLDVHLLASRVLVLTAHRVVVLELVWKLLLVDLVLVIIQQRLGVWHSHEQPGQALELSAAVRRSTSLVVEQQTQVGAHWGNASACGQHDDVCLWVRWQQHLSSSGASDEHIIAHAHVANVIGAHATVDLVLRKGGTRLVGLILALGAVAELAIQLHHTLHAQGHGLGTLIITHRRGGNGIQTDLGGLLTLLVRAWCNHANGLSLNVWHLTSMVKGHVGGLPIGISSGFGQGLMVEVVGHNLALVWRFRGEQVPRNLLAMHHLHALLLHSSCIAAGG